MPHKYHDELSAMADTLKNAITEAEGLPSDMGAVKIRITNDLRKQINFIRGIVGSGISAMPSAQVGELTTILGSPIQRAKPVQEQDLQPTNHERDEFISDRDNLHAQFLSLKDEQIFTKSKMAGGDAVVRAVAKMVGVPNYADAKINQKFIQKIREAIQANADVNADLKAAEEAVNNLDDANIPQE